jgi:tetratricopeptide (TPR) repeat protein
MQKIIIIFLMILCFVFQNYSQDNTSDTNNQSNSSAVSTNSSISSSNSSSIVTKPAEKNGWDYYQEGRYLESVNALKKEKEYFPGRINIYVILGWDYKMLKSYNEMEKISLEGLNISSDDTRVIYNLIEAYIYQNKFEQAIDAIEKYIFLTYQRVDQNVAMIYYYLGMCYYNLNQFRKSDIAFSTANYYKPDNTDILLKLAIINEKLGEKSKAKNFYSKVIIKMPNNQEALDGLKRVGAQ